MAALRRTPSEKRAFAELSAKARKAAANERGSPWKNPEFIKQRATTLPRTANGNFSAAESGQMRSRRMIVCLYCKNESEPIYQRPWQAKRNRQLLHDRCRIEIERLPDIRNSRALLYRAKGSPAALKQRLGDQTRAVRDRAKKNRPIPGPKPTLFRRDLELAKEAWRLTSEEHLTTRQIAERWQWSLVTRGQDDQPIGTAWGTGGSTKSRKYLDARNNPGTHETVQYLVLLGGILARGPLPVPVKPNVCIGKIESTVIFPMQTSAPDLPQREGANRH